MDEVERIAGAAPARLTADGLSLKRSKVGDASVLGRRVQKELLRHTMPDEEILFFAYGAPPQPTKTFPLVRTCVSPRKWDSTRSGRWV